MNALSPVIEPPANMPSQRFEVPASEGLPGYGQTRDLGANWRLQFRDVDGIPLNMLSFEVIDFGAISYKEIFQNVKTILATPIFSAALERLLGIDQNIVDRPMNDAVNATVAILQALYFWEPRVEVINIDFESDVISGHLIVILKLKIQNVIYGTQTPYEKTNISIPIMPEDNVVTQGPPGPPGPPGPVGPVGARGSVWFTGAGDPTSTMAPAPPPIGAPRANDMYLNTTSGDVFQYQQTTSTSGVVTFGWKKVATGK